MPVRMRGRSLVRAAPAGVQPRPGVPPCPPRVAARAYGNHRPAESDTGTSEGAGGAWAGSAAAGPPEQLPPPSMFANVDIRPLCQREPCPQPGSASWQRAIPGTALPCAPPP